MPMVQCQYCDKTRDKSNISRHVKNSHPEHYTAVIRGSSRPREQCRICQNTFLTAQWKRHYRNVHKLSNKDCSLARAGVPITGGSPNHVNTSVELDKSSESDELFPSGIDHASGSENRVDLAKFARLQSQNRYETRCKDGWEMLSGMVENKLQLLREHNELRSRYYNELMIYQKMVENCVSGTAISCDEYLQISAEDARNPVHNYKYVVCTSMDEARAIMRKGAPFLPVIIPETLQNTVPIYGPGGYLEYLQLKTDVDVHTFEQDAVDEAEMEVNNHKNPITMSSAKAVQLFASENLFPVNMLNLEGATDWTREATACVAGLPEYTVLKLLTDNQKSGKEEKYYLRDLTSASEFAICGQKGVFSLPHVDQAAFMALVGLHAGRKAWLTGPRLTSEELEDWMRSGLPVPDVAFMNIDLARGDVLIQPANRVHSPATLEDALGLGTMLWNSKSMAVVVEALLLKRKWPQITNEPDEAHEATYKLNKIRELWSKQSHLWPWGTSSDWVRFQRGVQTYNAPFCDCRKRRCGRHCVCFKARVSCSEYCHVSTDNDCENREDNDEDNGEDNNNDNGQDGGEQDSDVEHDGDDEEEWT